MRFKSDKAFISFILFITLVVYANSLKNGFVWDDILFIEEADFIKDWRNIFTVFTEAYFAHSWKNLDVNRPLMVFSLMVDYHIWGQVPFGYHLSNIFLHLANVVLVYVLLKHLSISPNASRVGTIMFAIHPIQSEAVNGINFREDLLVTFFLLLAFIYLKRLAESGLFKYYIISLVSFLLALLSKEAAVGFLPLAIFFLFIFRKKVDKRYFAGYLLVLLLYLIFLSVVYSYADIPSKTGRVKGILPNLTSAIIAAAHYCKMALVPINLSVIHTFNFPISEYRFQATDFVAMLAFLFFVFIVWRTSKVHKRVSLFFGLWSLVLFLPALPVVITYLTIMERFFYLPMVGVCGIIGIAYDLSPVRQRRLVSILFVCLFLILAVNTINRNNIWKSDSTLWRDTIKKAPQSEIAYNNLGLALLKEAKIEPAITAFRQSLSIRPNADAYYKLGFIYLKDKKYDLAVSYLNAALKTRGSADIPDIHNQLGLAYAMKGRYQNAVQAWLYYIKSNPTSAEAYNNLGSAYAKLGLSEKAIDFYRRALNIDPDYDKAKHNLAIILRNKTGIKAGAPLIF